ncbi:MAG TPA: DUF3105 domain-containing protein [Dehalococcoidia bacterium]|nr:DUF3105 domain-containing protein [Dehalococcoidia bacterium]
MSREQRRMDRRAQGRNAPPPRRQQPVRVGREVPWMALAITVGAVVVVALLAYLVIQSRGDNTASASGAQKAAQDSSPSIPGTYVPDQGRGHFTYGYTVDRPQTPFCPGVPRSAAADQRSAPLGGATGTAGAGSPQPSGTPAASGTPTPASTAAGEATGTSGTPAGTATPRTDCYASNPPSSGRHLNVARNVDIGNGAAIDIPPDPDVYPDDIEIPREAIPHILEHAGVFVGWNCADGDQQCLDAVQQTKDIVNKRIDNNKDRVVMAHDTDLPEGTIGLSSWTRVEDIPTSEFDKDRVTNFIAKNECRVDWENFC